MARDHLTRLATRGGDQNGKSARRILVLNDQYPFAHDLPNLGDRALQLGFRTLLESCCEAEVLSGRWKAFPSLTGSRYRSSAGTPRDVLDRWVDDVLECSEFGARLEWPFVRLARSRLCNNWFTSAFDHRARTHTGLGMAAALEPRFSKAFQACRLRAQMARADLVVFNAGGLIADHLENYLPERLFQLYLAQRLGRPTALMNYSMSLSDADHVALARVVLSGIDVHIVRDPISRERLTAIGVPSERVSVAPDAAFALEIPCEDVARDPLDVAIMVRGDRPVDLNAWASLVEWLRVNHGVRVHYLHGCAKHDPPVRRALAARCRLEGDEKVDDLPALHRKLAGMGLVISDRYHGAVFAVQTRTPVVAIASTTHKTDGLFRTFDYPVPVLPPLTEAGLHDCLRWIEVALREGPSLSRELARIHAVQRERLFEEYGRVFARLGVCES